MGLTVSRSASVEPIAPVEVKRGRPTYLWFLAPCLIFLGAFSLIPPIVTLYLSLQHYDLNFPNMTGFAGVTQYERMFADEYFWNSIVVTLILIAGPVAAQMVLGLLLALLLHNNARLFRLSRSLFIAPMVIPPVIAGLIWKMLLIPNLGGVNALLGVVGLPGPNWLASPGLAVFSVGMVGVWQDTPFVMLLLLAALQGLPSEPLEAARVDGASPWQLFRDIMFPLLVPALLVALLFRVINSLAIFPIIYVLTGGGPGRATEMLNYYTYTQAFQYLNLGYGAALAVALFVLVLLLSLAFVLLRRRVVEVE